MILWLGVNFAAKLLMNMKIRIETPADYCEVENLTREAFWDVYRPGCTEHFVLNRARARCHISSHRS